MIRAPLSPAGGAAHPGILSIHRGTGLILQAAKAASLPLPLCVSVDDRRAEIQFSDINALDEWATWCEAPIHHSTSARGHRHSTFECDLLDVPVRVTCVGEARCGGPGDG